MGITTRCHDDGPLIEFGESETSTNDGDGGGTGFDGGFVDVNTCKLDETLDSIADFLKDLVDIFGGGGGDDGGGDPPPEGGGDPPPEDGGDPPPEDGGDPPPEDGGDPPPEGGNGGGGEESGFVIDVSGGNIGWVKLYRPLGSAATRLAVPSGTYHRVGDKILLPVRHVPRKSRVVTGR